MRCFIGFFGLSRFLRHTACAVHTGIYDPLRTAGIETVRVGHFNLPQVITNPRSGELGIVPDRDESALLELDLCWAEPQDRAAIAAEFAVGRAFPDALGDQYKSLANLCYQLHSLKRLWSLMQLLGIKESDFVLLLRPDLLYLDRLDPALHLAPLLEGRADLIVPGWQAWGGLNDRFAFCTGRAAEIYATRMRLFGEACSRMHGIHPEGFLRFVAESHGLRVALTDLRAARVRANGKIAANDIGMIHRPASSAVETPTAAADSGGRAAADAAPCTTMQHERTQADRLEPRRPPDVSTLRLHRIMTDGLARVSPIGGTHYLKFLDCLHRQRRIGRYLEIGTQRGMSLNCASCRSVAIDPEFLLDKAQWAARPGINLFEMTSDEFFSANDPCDILGGPIDLAFIDGMHLSEFVLRDFFNVEKYCSEDSLIVLHDVLPQNFEMTERDRRPLMRRDRALAAAWTGDVWRVVPLLRRERPDLCIQVLDCPPTGLLLVSKLNPQHQVSGSRLEELTLSLADREPPESAFWSFIEAEAVLSSASMVSATPLSSVAA
jgi:hypothetical protein